MRGNSHPNERVSRDRRNGQWYVWLWNGFCWRKRHLENVLSHLPPSHPKAVRLLAKAKYKGYNAAPQKQSVLSN